MFVSVTLLSNVLNWAALSETWQWKQSLGSKIPQLKHVSVVCWYQWMKTIKPVHCRYFLRNCTIKMIYFTLNHPGRGWSHPDVWIQRKLLSHSHQELMFKTVTTTSVFFHYDGKEAHLNIWSGGQKLAEFCKALLTLQSCNFYGFCRFTWPVCLTSHFFFFSSLYYKL